LATSQGGLAPEPRVPAVTQCQAHRGLGTRMWTSAPHACLCSEQPGTIEAAGEALGVRATKGLVTQLPCRRSGPQPHPTCVPESPFSCSQTMWEKRDTPSQATGQERRVEAPCSPKPAAGQAQPHPPTTHHPPPLPASRPSPYCLVISLLIHSSWVVLKIDVLGSDPTSSPK
jgi:hypothetical protein